MPFYGENTENLFQNILAKQPNFKNELLKNYSEDFIDFLKNLLNKS